MTKALTLIGLIIVSCLLAGLYGILHDQLTYTISPEYYTKFKFYQFGLIDIGNEAIFTNPRIVVSVVGVLATWWMGISIGLILGFTGLIHNSWRTMFKVTFKAFLLTILIAFATGILGLVYGQIYLVEKSRSEFESWIIPENLIDFESFIKVGSMHNFSYIGGLTGLIGGLAFTLTQWRKLKQKESSDKELEKMGSTQQK